MALGFGFGFGFSPKQSAPIFSTQQRKELLRIASSCPGFSCQGAIGAFLDLWLTCEVLAKKLIMYHKKSNELPTHWTYEQVTAATKYFKLNIDPQIHQAIFKGGHGKRGENTPRQLRNGYLHSMSPADAKEIETRFIVLTSSLEGWRKKLIEI